MEASHTQKMCWAQTFFEAVSHPDPHQHRMRSDRGAHGVTAPREAYPIGDIQRKTGHISPSGIKWVIAPIMANRVHAVTSQPDHIKKGQKVHPILMHA